MIISNLILSKKEIIQYRKSVTNFFKKQESISPAFIDVIRNYSIDFLKGVPNAFIIKFEDFTIKNSRNLEHRISDLFLVFRSHLKNLPGFYISDLFRGSRTISEKLGDYHHSHYYRGSLCLGSSRHYYDTMVRENPFYGISMLKSFLKWESLEGVPHKRIGNLHGVVKIKPYSEEDIKEKMKQVYSSININIANNKVKVEIPAKFFSETPIDSDLSAKNIKGDILPFDNIIRREIIKEEDNSINVDFFFKRIVEQSFESLITSYLTKQK